MNIVGIKHGNQVYFVNADNYNNINSIARNTKGAVVLGSNALQALVGVAAMFGNIGKSNLNHAQRGADEDAQIFCNDIKNGLSVSYNALKDYGLAEPVKDGTVCPIKDLGGMEMIDGLFGLNLAKHFKFDADLARPVKVSKVKASEADELAQAIKLSKLSAQEQQEENELAEALRLNKIEANNKKQARQEQFKLAEAQLLSIVHNKAMDDAEQAQGHELNSAELSAILDVSINNVEHFLNQHLDLLGLDSAVLYEIYSAE
jgi:hypothetical protein